MRRSDCFGPRSIYCQMGEYLEMLNLIFFLFLNNMEFFLVQESYTSRNGESLGSLLPNSVSVFFNNNEWLCRPMQNLWPKRGDILISLPKYFLVGWKVVVVLDQGSAIDQKGDSLVNFLIEYICWLLILIVNVYMYLKLNLA